MTLPARISRPSPQRSVAKAEDKKARTAQWHVGLVKQIGICAATGMVGPTDAHHLMRGVERGTSFRAAGRYTIPLSRRVHDEITPKGDPEGVLLEKYGLLARELSDALWSASPDIEAMTRATLRAYQDAVIRKAKARTANDQ